MASVLWTQHDNETYITVICLAANVFCPDSNKAVIKKKMNVANSILWCKHKFSST